MPVYKKKCFIHTLDWAKCMFRIVYQGATDKLY